MACLQALGDIAEDDMFAIQPRGLDGAQEELAAQHDTSNVIVRATGMCAVHMGHKDPPEAAAGTQQG